MRNMLRVTLGLFAVLTFAQAQSHVFYKGGFDESVYLWPWGFAGGSEPIEASNTGYTPGTAGLKWVTYDDGGYQGAGFYLNDNSTGVDFSSVWSTESVHFKLKAATTVQSTDTLHVLLYDTYNSDWNHAIYYKIPAFDALNDGAWHSYSVPLTDFTQLVDPINQDSIAGISFETANLDFSEVHQEGIAAEFYIDDVWIGSPEISLEMTLFDGMTVVPGAEWSAWGFENTETITLAAGEGFQEGTNAIVWETSDWNWQGMGFAFDAQDMSHSITTDTMRAQIKAPAGINDLDFILYDWSDNQARFTLTNVWDAEWQLVEVPFAEMTQATGFDPSTVYYFAIEATAEDLTVPERVLIDNVWSGNPDIIIDLVAPGAISALDSDSNTPYINQISWTALEGEVGESYDLFASFDPILYLDTAGVFLVASDVPAGEIAVHNLLYPLGERAIDYYYAVIATDASGNKSESFYASPTAVSNLGKARAIISLDAPSSFAADGDLSEWSHIQPFVMNPSFNKSTGDYSTAMDDSLDYAVKAYVAMDDTYLYVAFDVVDDVFSWTAENTSDWWNDENIEFYFGLYELGNPHPYRFSGTEPDYRIVFKPYELEFSSVDTLVAEGGDDYYFQPLGNADYIVEARIPYSLFQDDDDTAWVPTQGTVVPFEIFAADVDVANADNESRLQLGDSNELNPNGTGPKGWTYTWVGTPDFWLTVDEQPGFAQEFSLGNNYPNPFNPTTNIAYSLPVSGKVELTVYNVIGQEVAKLTQGHQEAGSYTVQFNGASLASGIYFYRLTTADFNQVNKMILLK